jgi:hypothetical protein
LSKTVDIIYLTAGFVIDDRVEADPWRKNQAFLFESKESADESGSNGG